MSDPTDWPRFTDSVLEGRRRPLADYVRGPVTRPPCDVEVGHNMFLETATIPG